jgi:ubiquinol-cytochrome c reductase cytochrome c1 subunit
MNCKYFFLFLFFFFTLSFVHASDDLKPPKQIDWAFDGVKGSFDRQSIQRGLQVYREVCSACHSINRIAFRNFEEIGLSPDEVKSLAADYNVQDGPNDEGLMYERPALPSDQVPGPYANDKAARSSNNGALPPDLSLIIKARKDGANYVYSLLTGYTTPPKDFVVGENMHYNPYFSGGGSQFAMTPPLTKDGQVQYSDGTPSTVDQMTKDIVNFLQWAAEPEMEMRKGIGFSVMIFLSIFTLLFYWAKRRIWKHIK